jgi:hypothetical protein
VKHGQSPGRVLPVSSPAVLTSPAWCGGSPCSARRDAPLTVTRQERRPARTKGGFLQSGGAGWCPPEGLAHARRGTPSTGQAGTRGRGGAQCDE